MFGSVDELPKAQGEERLAQQQRLHPLVPGSDRIRAEVHLPAAERDRCHVLNRSRIVEVDTVESQGSYARKCDYSAREYADPGCIHWLSGGAQLATEESAVQQNRK